MASRGAVLDRSWALCRRSWAPHRAFVAGLGPLLGLCGRSWATLGPYVGALGPLLGPMFEILRCLGVSVGGFGKGSGRELALARAEAHLGGW